MAIQPFLGEVRWIVSHVSRKPLAYWTRGAAFAMAKSLYEATGIAPTITEQRLGEDKVWTNTQVLSEADVLEPLTC